MCGGGGVCSCRSYQQFVPEFPIYRSVYMYALLSSTLSTLLSTAHHQSAVSPISHHYIYDPVLFQISLSSSQTVYLVCASRLCGVNAAVGHGSVSHVNTQIFQ